MINLPRVSSVAEWLRPTGDVLVKVRVAASYLSVKVLPFMVVVSVNVVNDNGLLGIANTTERWCASVEVSPPVCTVTLVVIGADIEKRESGPNMALTDVPSAYVVVRLPFFDFTD